MLIPAEAEVARDSTIPSTMSAYRILYIVSSFFIYAGSLTPASI
jgi:hypothetical protein